MFGCMCARVCICVCVPVRMCAYMCAHAHGDRESTEGVFPRLLSTFYFNTESLTEPWNLLVFAFHSRNSGSTFSIYLFGRVLHRPGYPGTHFVDQVCFKLKELHMPLTPHLATYIHILNKTCVCVCLSVCAGVCI